MISVTLIPYGKIEEVSWRKGMTVSSLIKRFKWEAAPVRVLINGKPANESDELIDGDKVEIVLFPIVAGG